MSHTVGRTLLYRIVCIFLPQFFTVLLKLPTINNHLFTLFDLSQSRQLPPHTVLFKNINKYQVINTYLFKNNPIRSYCNFQYETINNKLKLIKLYLSFLDVQIMQTKEFLMSSFLQVEEMYGTAVLWKPRGLRLRQVRCP